jgi:hypothetical protein
MTKVIPQVAKFVILYKKAKPQTPERGSLKAPQHPSRGLSRELFLLLQYRQLGKG